MKHLLNGMEAGCVSPDSACILPHYSLDELIIICDDSAWAVMTLQTWWQCLTNEGEAVYVCVLVGYSSWEALCAIKHYNPRQSDVRRKLQWVTVKYCLLCPITVACTWGILEEPTLRGGNIIVVFCSHSDDLIEIFPGGCVIPRKHYQWWCLSVLCVMTCQPDNGSLTLFMPCGDLVLLLLFDRYMCMPKPITSIIISNSVPNCQEISMNYTRYSTLEVSLDIVRWAWHFQGGFSWSLFMLLVVFEGITSRWWHYCEWNLCAWAYSVLVVRKNLEGQPGGWHYPVFHVSQWVTFLLPCVFIDALWWGYYRVGSIWYVKLSHCFHSSWADLDIQFLLLSPPCVCPWPHSVFLFDQPHWRGWYVCGCDGLMGHSCPIPIIVRNRQTRHYPWPGRPSPTLL